MTIKEKMYAWLDRHPEELRKTGWGANEELRKAFPKVNRKTISMYKNLYKRDLKERQKSTESESKPDNLENDSQKAATDATENSAKNYKSNKVREESTTKDIVFKKELILLLLPLIILIIWLIRKPKE